MAAISLTDTSVSALKNALRDEFVETKSSHLSEALAAAMGYRTYASLRAALHPVEADAPFVLLDSVAMRERVRELDGYQDDDFDFEMMRRVVPELVSTECPRGYEFTNDTARKRAWRNVLVLAINTALDRKLFTLRPGDNRFGSGQVFDFELPNAMPARGYVHDAGFDELTINVAVVPKENGSIRSMAAGFDGGEAYGSTWLERKLGFWMQSYHSAFACRRHLMPILEGLEVRAQGYGDHGRVIN